MLVYQKKIFKSIFAIVGLCSLLEAIPLNAPGPYLSSSKVKDSNDSVRFSFRDNSNNENKFRINIYDNESNRLFKSININGSNKGYGYATVTNFHCDKVYKAVVTASNDEGNSSPSDFTFFQMKSTFGVSCPQSPNVEVPTAPGAYLGITEINETAVRIGFLDNSENEDGFIVYGEGINLKLPKNDETKHSFQYATLTNLTCSKDYKIKVIAYNGEGNSSSSSSRQFNIQNTFGRACSNIPPTVKLSISYRTREGTNGDEYRVYNVSARATDSDGKIVQCEWSGDYTESCESYNNFNYIMGFGDEYDYHRNDIFTITVTDDDGATATDTIQVYDSWYEREADDTISIGSVPNIFKIGQTALVDAYIHDIIPRRSCGTSVHGHGWSDSNNLFSLNDSLYEIGHFICYGYRASTALTATEKGDTIVTLSSGIGSKSFPIQVVDANNSIDSIKKVVVDNLTGLMWADIESPLKPFVTESNYQLYNFYDYVGDTAKTYCEALEWGGYTNWRLPTLFEVTGYITPQNNKEYWSSTEIPETRDTSSILSSKVLSHSKNQLLFTLCVRK